MYGRVTGLCLATTLFICGLAGFPTPPSSLPAATGSLTMSQTAGEDPLALTPGASVHLKGNGFSSGAPVTVAVYSRPQTLASVIADGSGRIDVTVRLPRDLAPGPHTLVALGVGPHGEAVVLQAPIKIADPNPAVQLAYTGFNVLTWLAAAALCIIVGLVLVRTGMMRRRLAPARSELAEPVDVG